MCGDGLVCAPEGICVACGLTTFRSEVLGRISNEFGEKENFVEKEHFVRPTREPNGSEFLSTTESYSGPVYGNYGGGGSISCGVGVVVLAVM